MPFHPNFNRVQKTRTHVAGLKPIINKIITQPIFKEIKSKKEYQTLDLVPRLNNTDQEYIPQHSIENLISELQNTNSQTTLNDYKHQPQKSSLILNQASNRSNSSMIRKNNNRDLDSMVNELV